MCVRSRAPASRSRSHSHEVSRSLEISRGQRAEIRLAIQITDSPLLITPGAGPRVLPVRTPLTGSPVRTPAATTLPRRECAPRDLLLLERDGETHRRETGALRRLRSTWREERWKAYLSFLSAFFLAHGVRGTRLLPSLKLSLRPLSLRPRGARGGRAGWLWAQV